MFPFPVRRDPAEEDRIRALNAAFRAYAAEHVDSREIDRAGWIEEQVFLDLGELGLMGLYVPEQYGGQGLSQTGYARVFETLGQADGSLTVALGVHQSIGMKGIVLFGTDEQKARFLPDLAAGRKLAGFALTEPEAGSDAYNLRSRAVEQADGSWVLNGEKRWIGNGGRGSVFVVFARTEVGGKDRHTAFILEKGTPGFEAGEPYDTMGLRGNNLCPLSFHDVRIAPENVLGEPGEGFHIAMQILNNGRMSLGTGAVGLAKRLLDLTIEHVTERRQFGQPIGDFDMVEDKVGWMVAYLFGLESMAYLTTGLVDAGVEDYAVESAMAKVAGTEFVWYQANRALQLKGGQGYMRTEPYEQIVRDIRVFPIFEGANDVLRSFVALSALKPLGEQLELLSDVDLRDPIGTLGTFAEYALGRIRREVRPHAISRAHPDLGKLADRTSGQVAPAARGGRGAAAPPRARHRGAGHEPQALRRRARRRLRADRRARARHRHLRGAGRGGLRPGAVHRRHVLHAGRRSRRPRPGSPPRQRRRPHALDRPAGLPARGLRLRAVRGLTPRPYARWNR